MNGRKFYGWKGGYLINEILSKIGLANPLRLQNAHVRNNREGNK